MTLEEELAWRDRCRTIDVGGDDVVEVKPDPKHRELFHALYCTLTTSQIDKALRHVGKSHKDWIDFCKAMS